MTTFDQPPSIAEYPLALLRMARASSAKHFGEAIDAVAGLDSEIALMQLGVMFAELMTRHDTECHHDPGWTLERLESQYTMVAALAAEKVVRPHPSWFGGDRPKPPRNRPDSTSA